MAWSGDGQEMYTALTDDGQQLYGNLDVKQEEYTEVLATGVGPGSHGTSVSRGPSARSQQPAFLNDSFQKRSDVAAHGNDEEQSIYANFEVPADKPKASKLKDQLNRSVASPQAPSQPEPDQEEYANFMPKATTEPDQEDYANFMPKATTEPDQEDYANFMPKTAPEPEQENYANFTPSAAKPPVKDYYNVLSAKDGDPKTDKDADDPDYLRPTNMRTPKAAQNVYGPEPSKTNGGAVSGSPSQPENFPESFLPTRKPARSAGRCAPCSRTFWVWYCVVAGVLTLISAGCLIFQLHQLGMIDWTYSKAHHAAPSSISQLEQLAETLAGIWTRQESFGNTIDLGLMINVASIHHGGSCVVTVDGQTYDPQQFVMEELCQYAIDGDTSSYVNYSHAIGQRLSLQVFFDARYRVALTEVLWEWQNAPNLTDLVYSTDGKPKTATRQMIQATQPTSQRARDITIHPNATSRGSFTIDFPLNPDAQIYEIRVYGFGDQPDTVSCPPDFVKSRGLRHCYHVSTVTKTFGDAKVYCQDKNASLLTLHSKAEHDFVRSLLPNDARANYLTDLVNTTSGWRWAEIFPLQYRDWKDREPSSPTTERCMELNTFNNFQFNDKTCDPRATGRPICDMPSKQRF